LDKWLGRPLWAEIDLDAIAGNIAGLRRRIGDRTELLAVVKANGYGHGAVPVAKTALEAGAQRLGVACLDEAVQLRTAGISAPILILGHTPVWEAERLVEYKVTPTIDTRQLALAVARFSTERGIVTPVHLKVETGTNRFGLTPNEVVDFAQFLCTLPGLEVEGLYTHFAAADEEDKTFTRQQFKLFLSTAERLPWVPCRHVANSAAVLDEPGMCLDMVRPGISIYGCYPSSQVSNSVQLRPALSLKSRIVRLHDLAPGETVSYGGTWMAQKPTRIALVPCGYADGLPRILSNKGSMLIRGSRAPIVGRICMDQCVVDVGHIPGVALGDEVVVIGKQWGGQIAVEELADLAGTINYEILCAISPRVPRVYLKAGAIVQVRTLTDELEAGQIHKEARLTEDQR